MLNLEEFNVKVSEAASFYDLKDVLDDLPDDVDLVLVFDRGMALAQTPNDALDLYGLVGAKEALLAYEKALELITTPDEFKQYYPEFQALLEGKEFFLLREEIQGLYRKADELGVTADIIALELKEQEE